MQQNQTIRRICLQMPAEDSPIVCWGDNSLMKRWFKYLKLLILQKNPNSNGKETKTADGDKTTILCEYDPTKSWYFHINLIRRQRKALFQEAHITRIKGVKRALIHLDKLNPALHEKEKRKKGRLEFGRKHADFLEQRNT